MERTGFYARTLERLLAEGVLDRAMSILAAAGGEADASVFRGLGFEDVTISNVDERVGGGAFEPYSWSYQDAESLTFEDGSFDWGVVSAGLHHCRSPHRALLELYRVARRGILALESRDSALMRAAIRFGVIDEYELTAVAAHDFRSGGVGNTSVPNYVYRWTEREVEKTIASAAPHARHRILYFHELELPLSIFEVGGRRVLGRALRTLQPVARLVARALPGQANLFAFAVLKPELPRDLQPWLRLEDAGPAPDESWIRSRLGS